MQSFLVENIPEEGVELSEEEDPCSLGLRDNELVSYAGNLTVSLMLEKVGERVRITGEVSFKVKFLCARCLEPFSQGISFPLNIVYEPESSRVIKKEVLLKEEETDTFYYGKEGIIELGNAIREYVIISLPAKPLCRPDCSGLCPICGKKLNQGQCQCQSQRVDPRFSKLKDLKND